MTSLDDSSSQSPAWLVAALRALEWPRFLALAEKEARTAPGKARTQAYREPAAWAPDIGVARKLQQETQEAAQLLDRDALWGPLTGLEDPDAILDRLGRSAILEIEELVALRKWIYAIDSWSQVPRDEIRGELFRKTLTQLPDPLAPLRILDKVLTPEGELSERASPKLAGLYVEIRGLKRQISVILDQMIKTYSQKGVLQENFHDVRDGRYVIPIKISSQSEIDGIIYEASASRQTVFVEPKEVAPLNNRLRQRQNELVQEIYEILQDVSKRLQPFGPEIAQGVALLSHWDCVQARARFGTHFGGKAIHVVEERHFLLEQTAHPLLYWSLKPEQIIRNEVDFGDPVRSLLITGPNTGGKTVLLKTLGLASLCARTGFPFPGIGQPQVPFFHAVFADLGDAQSIEQHLSSFSGHILRFKEILENVTSESLVLIDELNTATDPEEGAALGRAFLESVMGEGAMIVTTTHDPHLKALAVSDERILNASMAFDESARTPTYRIVLGVPGRSRALETAERLGIPKRILDLARSYLTREHQEFEDKLSRLESEIREAEHARKEAVHLRNQAEKMHKEWTEKTELSVGDLLDRTRLKLRRILEQAQDEVRSSVRKLDEVRNRKEIDQTRANLNETVSIASSRLERALEEEAPELADALDLKKGSSPVPEPTAVVEGATVRIPKWKSTGKVLEVSGGKVRVAMGAIQMSLSMADVDPISGKEAEAAAAQARSLEAHQKKSSKIRQSLGLDTPSAPGHQIDLRGVRLDDAMSRLEQYLDQAFRSGAYAEVTVVHGLGTGAIREGARKLIQSLPYVKEYRDGGVGLGGAGATIVEFDR